MSKSEVYDLVIRNGLVVDGSGLPGKHVDIGITDGKIAKIGVIKNAKAKDEIDAKGCVVAPGIIDAHTHYDPQITFDPYATMSCFHGVTTVLAGNCGFSAAPVRKKDRAVIASIFARVEDMDPIALDGVKWEDCETFPDFIKTRNGRLGVNFACYVGHSNVRRFVMGEDAHTRAATDAEIETMCEVVDEALKAGAAGFSSSAAPTHVDMQGKPVPSRFADHREVLAIANVVGQHGAGSICFLPSSAIKGLDSADEDYLIEIGKAARVPIILQGVGGRNKTDAPTATWPSAVAFFDRANAAGAQVYSLLGMKPFDRSVVFNATNFHYRAVPSWHDMLQLPVEKQAALLRDPKAREEMRFAVENYNRDPDKGTTVPPPIWPAVFIDTSPTMKPEQYQGRSVTVLAAEKGVPPGDFVLDLALADNFQTKMRWQAGTSEWTDAVDIAQRDPRMIMGTSDGGAHLAKDDGSDWSSYFLRRWVMDDKVWSLEEGIRQITQIPAALLGFADRGMLRVGYWADIMIFDKETIGPWRKEFVHDLPGGVGRYKAWGKGVHATIVNGQAIVLDGKLTDKLPGAVVAPV